jgi:uncharacterized protein YecT (DUF1311 family)
MLILRACTVLILIGYSAMPVCGQTQADLTGAAGQRLIAAENRYENCYLRIVERYRANKSFLRHFKDADRAWMRCQDAYIDAIYPGNPDLWGSVRNMCEYGWRRTITEQRTRQLKAFLSIRKYPAASKRSFLQAYEKQTNVYKAVAKAYNNNKDFVQALDQAEIAWLRFSGADADAFCSLRRGNEQARAFWARKTDLAWQHVKDLRLWLDGIPDGEVCCGTMPWRSHRAEPAPK